MAFATSFLTGALTRQLENWGAEDAAIATKVSEYGEKFAEADKNALEKVNFIRTVGGDLYSKYGDKGIQQLNYALATNRIDFSRKSNEVADELSQMKVPKEFIDNIENPYLSLGENVQSMYEADTSVYSQALKNLNLPDKTGELFMKPRDFTETFTKLQEVPSMGAEPITSIYGEDASTVTKKQKDNVNIKVATIIGNNPDITIDEILASDELNPLEKEIFKTDLQYKTTEDRINETLMTLTSQKALMTALGSDNEEAARQKLLNVFGSPNQEQLKQSYEDKLSRSVSDDLIAAINENPVAQLALQNDLVVVPKQSLLSAEEINAGFIELDTDAIVDDKERNSIVEKAANEGKTLKVLSQGYEFYIPF